MIKQNYVRQVYQQFKEQPLGKELLRAKLRVLYPISGQAIYLARSIQGWLTDMEGDALYKLAKDFTPEMRPVVVEIGSWKGKSSSIIAAGLSGKDKARLFCLDPFGVDEDPEYQSKYYSDLLSDKKDVLDTFKVNMARCGVANIVTPIKGYSFDIIKGWETQIDFLFIDGNHEYDAVMRDFVLWSPFVKIGGVVALHDTVIWPGPTKVVQEKLTPPGYSDVKRVDTLTWAIKLA